MAENQAQEQRVERKERAVDTQEQGVGGMARLAEGASAVGAILVVLAGVGAVFVLSLVALGTVPNDQKSTVVAAAFSVLGTIVGAYFGVRVGAAGKERAEAAQQAASIRLEEMAAVAPKDEAREALRRADNRIAQRVEGQLGHMPPSVL
jgi:hypothetical protein